ncbi:CGGC domain-containing protein [Pseudodesulfovibrio sp. JC047]|uniref:CGGC domain-containing protein n=1 Tax=Pseudodesulfovibrio sp. JC047 TaxID=2683199 RepID=UPI0013D8680D|nr:CGGC domain-containing protein [Pseudodesulfovibrio sp. JC047]NDV18325.1 CGGC domain-containing protein [Pseudodesulfovibrio sp. JC047]
MTKIGIIRCEKNETTCPLTGCLTCLHQKKQAFSSYDDPEIIGVFTCRCPGDTIENMAKILKAKGAEAIHIPTCLFSSKTDGKWFLEPGGFCADIDELTDRINKATGLPCVKGTAHLPEGYTPAV